MAVDQGSLRYKIELESDKAVKGLKDFREGLLKSRRSFRAFRQDVSRLGTGAKQLKNTLRDLAKVTVEGAEASVKASKATDKSVRVLKKANKEHAKATASKKKEAKVTKELTVVEKERLKLQKSLSAARARHNSKELRALALQLTTVRKVTRGYEKLALARNLARRGIDSKSGLKFADSASLKLLETQNSLRKLQAELENKALVSAKTKLSVLQRIADAESRIAQQKQLQAQGRGLSGLTTEQEAASRVAAAKNAMQVQQMMDQMRAADPFFQQFDKRVKSTSGRMEAMSKHASLLRTRMGALTQMFQKARSGANRVFFTFRRLIGIFAAFLIVRKVIQAFNGLIAGAVKYNAAIEQSVLGIASLITATSDIRSAIGSSTSAQEQLSLAIKESRRQISLLRKDALTTVATFRQLVDTYQVALGPGIAQGLDVDQIRNFTIQISQAAAAIGLAQNQLAEEIRSILMGTIQLRTTRIAAVLGITNADIRAAKEMGVLADFLNDRFRAFTEAGKEALSLYNAIIARLGDAINELLRQGSTDFFLELKDLLTDILESMVAIEDTGVTINPKALAVVESIFEGMRRAVAEAQRLRKVLNVSDLASAASALGSALGTTAEVLGAMVEGVVAGFKTIAKLLGPIAAGLKEALPDIDLQTFVRALTTALVVIVAMKAALGGVLGLVFFLVSPITKVVGLFTALVPVMISVGSLIASAAGALAGMSATTLAMVAASFALLVLFALITKEVFSMAEDFAGIEIQFETWVKIIRISLVQAFRFAAATAKVAFLSVAGIVKFVFNGLVNELRKQIIKILTVAKGGADLLGLAVAKKLQRTIDGLEERNKEFTDDTIKDAKALAAAVAELAEIAVNGTRKMAADINQALAENSTARTLEEMVDDTKKAVENALKSALGGLADQMVGFGGAAGEAKEEAIDLVAELNKLPGIVSRGARGIQGLAQQIQRLEQSLRKTSAELKESLDTVGLQGSSLEQRRVIAEEEFKLKEHAFQLDNRLAEVEKQKLALRLQSLNVEGKISALNDIDSRLAEEGLKHGTALLAIQDRLVDATHRLENSQALIIQARKGGHQEQLKELLATEKVQQRTVDQLTRGYNKMLNVVTFINDTVKKNPEISKDVLTLVVERIKLMGLEKSIEQDIIALLTQRSELEDLIAKRTLDRIKTIANERRFESQQNLKLLQAELLAEQTLFKFASALNTDVQGKALAQARATLLVETARRDVIQATLDAQVAGNAQILADSKALGMTKAESEKFRADQLVTEKEISTELKIQEELLKRAGIEAEEARKRKEEPLSFGLETAAAEFSAEALDDFTNFVEMGKEAITGFADFISSSIADAFDPTSDTDVAERFQQFLQMLSNMIIEYLVNKAIATVLASLLSKAGPEDPGPELLLAAAALALAGKSLSDAGGKLGGAAIPWFFVSSLISKAADKLTAAAILLLAANAIGGGGGGGVDKATGGSIHRRGSGPSRGHMGFGVQGFDEGGRIRNSSTAAYDRPAGIDPRDREPIWARVGEWVIRPEAVAKYGDSFMDMLNRGMVDPMLARSVSGARKAMSVSAPRQRGFATGGAVSGSDVSSGQEQVSRAVLVADEATYERLLAAGSSAQMRWVEDHSDEIRTIIS